MGYVISRYVCKNNRNAAIGSTYLHIYFSDKFVNYSIVDDMLFVKQRIESEISSLLPNKLSSQRRCCLVRPTWTEVATAVWGDYWSFTTRRVTLPRRYHGWKLGISSASTFSVIGSHLRCRSRKSAAFLMNVPSNMPHCRSACFRSWCEPSNGAIA